MNRRDFLKMTAVGAGATLAGSKLASAQTAVAPKAPTLIGMPISVAPLAGANLDRILGDMRDRAGVNALFPFIYSHEEHRAGVWTTASSVGPGEVYSATFRGGNYGIPHLQYYQDSGLTYADMRAPEFGDLDVLARVIAAGAKHGIRIYPFLLEDNKRPASIANWQKMAEIDLHGRPGNNSCKNNPYFRGFLNGLAEDYARSYDIGGLMWGSERQSGFLNALSLSQEKSSDPGRACCFCEFCQKKARDKGIDVARARLGFGEIEKFMHASRGGQKLADGHFSTFWRILLNYPELLAWENIWVTGRHEIEAGMHARVKSANPALPIGWHLWQNISFSPFQRAEEDYAVMKDFSDFVRPAVYNNCGGGRIHQFADGAHGGIFGDLSAAETLALIYRLLGYHEAPYDQVSGLGLSAGYVEHETRRAVTGLGSTAQVWPGIDIDVPVAPPATSQCTPDGIKDAVRAVFKGGGTGIILSRNYVEMKPAHLSAAGDALRELGLA